MKLPPRSPSDAPPEPDWSLLENAPGPDGLEKAPLPPVRREPETEEEEQ